MAADLVESVKAWVASQAAEVPMEDWVAMVKAEYFELPRLSLTRAQMQRLWGLDETLCDAIVGQLVLTEFLVEHEDGRIERPVETEGELWGCEDVGM